jgi:hypothetical protein
MQRSFQLLIALSTYASLAASASVTVNGLNHAHPVASAYVMPGEPVEIATTQDAHINIDGHPVDPTNLVAPEEPGLKRIEITTNAGDQFLVNLFVMTPAAKLDGGLLNGYRIGNYPTTPLRDNPAYLPPAGFIEVTGKNAGVQVSPNFTLGEFTSKQGSAFPKYVVLRPELIKKLEVIHGAVAKASGGKKRMIVMSGYRTPFYNHAIGNVKYSRHQWGDAADIFVDNDRDGNMDDLNQDGTVDVADARWLYDLVERLSGSGRLDGLVGGMGLYRANSAHGPFVHVDVRGSKARW